VPPDPDELLAKQLQQLRRDYLRDSDQRVAELRQLRARLAHDQRAALADLRQAFHRLAGSGGSYGFPDVTARSRVGERLIVRLEAAGVAPTPAEVAAIDQSIDAVANAFSEAKKSFGAEGSDKGS
jgi:chemotaxis protein histidine kinase CheA